MPQNREQIRHAPVSREVWRNNRTGVMTFDPRKIRPLGDHVLIELDREPEQMTTIVVPDIARNKDIGTRIGTVLAVGPGKWSEKHDRQGVKISERWQPTTLKPSQRVVIGHYSDWESWNCSADGHESRDANIVLCQENDVRVIIEEVEVNRG